MCKGRKNGHNEVFPPHNWKYTKEKGDVIFTCTGERQVCQYRVSPFNNTFFDGHDSKIPIGKVLQVMLLSLLVCTTDVNKICDICLNSIQKYIGI